ncbi:DUF3298 and DUF4163 domain-containing protein [uncultured Algibacter sp.]|uniref:DUF3298 and DUF4163 domain-containing protein n=1 Tax=uncultured Algibacter sp. TaxID=298659 RepID=UPI00260E51C2|nr:DUF3298 and DUF4163 domain-containing protein [uncultured Algibacter sp.]
MKFKHVLLIFSCALTFFNCKEEQKLIFSDINITTKSNSIVEVNIPEIIGNETISNKINSEIQKIVITALHIGNPDEITSTSIKESIELFNSEYNTFKNDFPDSFQPWEAQIDGEVMYQTTNIISIALTSYANTGGAHGILNISFLNFDIKTGQKIENKALFNDVEAVKKIVKSYLIDNTIEKNIFLEDNEFKLPENIGYSENGIIILYNTYEVAPYVSEIIEFAVPYNSIESYLIYNSF